MGTNVPSPGVIMPDIRWVYILMFLAIGWFIIIMTFVSCGFEAGLFMFFIVAFFFQPWGKR